MSHRPDAYNAAHLRLLDALLIQVAAATRNAFLYQQMRAELAERERVQAENDRLLTEARESAQRQRAFLRDVLASVTEGALLLCDAESDLPAPFTPWTSPVPLSMSSGLRELRHQAFAAAQAVGLPEERCYDLELAVGEAGMNAVVHAGEGIGQVFSDPDAKIVQVWVSDRGGGITVENLPPRDPGEGLQHEKYAGPRHEDDLADRQPLVAPDRADRHGRRAGTKAPPRPPPPGCDCPFARLPQRV